MGTGNKYSVRGGESNNRLFCGAFYINLGATFSAYWSNGASISYKPVVWMKGTGNNYARHGGNSYLGFICGLFCINLNIAASIIYWDTGASLSYKR